MHCECQSLLNSWSWPNTCSISQTSFNAIQRCHFGNETLGALSLMVAVDVRDSLLGFDARVGNLTRLWRQQTLPETCNKQGITRIPRAGDINSLNNCINTGVAKIFHVSFGNGVDFIRQMTGLINLRILVAERRSRFFSKLHQSSLFQTLLPLFYDRMF